MKMVKYSGQDIVCKLCKKSKTKVGSKKGVCSPCHKDRWLKGQLRKGRISEGFKTCCMCKKEQPLIEFQIKGPIPLESSRCLTCGPKRRDLLIKEADRQKIYSLYDTCVICKDPLYLNTRHLDHCHETMAVRGVLCSECNVGLGKLKESATLLRRAAEYIEREGDID